MLKYFSIILFASLVYSSASAQKEKAVKWLSFEEAMRLYKENPKPIFIDFYTNWCGWCKVMDTATFENKQVANYLNSHFYPVKFNAESTADVVLQDTTYRNDYVGKKDKNGKIIKRPPHSLALTLMRGKSSYPTTVYYLPNEKIIAPIPGYMTPDKIQPLLLYFGENIYKLNTFEAFSKGLELEPIVK